MSTLRCADTACGGFAGDVNEEGEPVCSSCGLVVPGFGPEVSVLSYALSGDTGDGAANRGAVGLEPGRQRIGSGAGAATKGLSRRFGKSASSGNSVDGRPSAIRASFSNCRRDYMGQIEACSRRFSIDGMVCENAKQALDGAVENNARALEHGFAWVKSDYKRALVDGRNTKPNRDIFYVRDIMRRNQLNVYAATCMIRQLRKSPYLIDEAEIRVRSRLGVS